MDKHKAIGEAPKSTRMQALAGAASESKVEREGGMFGAGIIRGVSAMTEGEALGHEAWVDAVLLAQVVESGNKGKPGIKARFTHPGLSSDGLGKLVGRFKDFRLEENKAIADIHILKSAHDTPGGNLAKHIMDLAEESPDLFATSIVFERDIGAEKSFEGDNSDEKGRFKSPDKKNKENFIHFRLNKLRAVDFVDEPAANPGGLFSAMGDGNDLPAEAFQVLDYAFGIKKENPPAAIAGIHPDRVRNTLQAYLSDRQISTVFQKPDDPGEDGELGEDGEAWATGEAPYLDGDASKESKKESGTETGADSHPNESEESKMDDLIKNLTAEQLGKERPDLVKKLQADLRAELEGEAKEQLKAERDRCVGIVEAGEKLGLLGGISERLTANESVDQATIALQAVKLDQFSVAATAAAAIEGTASDETHKTETPKPEPEDVRSYDEKFSALQAKFQSDGLDAVDAGVKAEQELAKEEGK